MKVFSSDRFVLPLPPHHGFPMSKYRRLREEVVEAGVVRRADVLEPEPASWEQLRLVHDAAYVDAVARGVLSVEHQRRIGFPWSPEMVERSRRSVGATLAAARAALVDGAAANLAGGTHHAGRDRGEGYCVFNDVAVAARVLLAEGVVRRIAVVDCDVHQGNGTAAIFRDEPAVFTLSVHAASNFPARKEAGDLDVALPDGTSDDAYLDALAVAMDAALAFAPELAFYVAGADPYAGDRWGRLGLTFDGLRRRDALVLGRLARARIPVAVTMGGGYAPDVEDIVRIHLQTLREAAKRRRWRHGGGFGALRGRSSSARTRAES